MTPEERAMLLARAEDTDEPALVDMTKDAKDAADEAYARFDVLQLALRQRMEAEGIRIALGERWKAEQEMVRDYQWPDLVATYSLLVSVGEDVGKLFRTITSVTLKHIEDWPAVEDALLAAGLDTDMFERSTTRTVKNSLHLMNLLKKLGPRVAHLLPTVAETPKGELVFEEHDGLPFD